MRTDGKAGAPASLASVAAGLPVWVDAASAAVVSAIACVSLLELPAPVRVEAGLVVVAAVAPWLVGLAWRRPPRLALHAAWTLAALVVFNVAGPGWGWVGRGDADQTVLFVGVWLVGQVVSLGSARLAWSSIAAVLAVVAARRALDPTFDSHVVWAAGVALAAGAGFAVRWLGTMVVDLREAQARLEQEAAAAERKRIAREVHDVVAHSLSVTMLHVTAARLAVAAGDPDAAGEALAEAERVGRSSLADVRRTVGLLRDPDAGDAPGPVAPALPSLADLPDLVASWAAAGLDVVLAPVPTTAGLDATAGLALYRIAQEALANTARHLPGATTAVTVTADHGHVHLVVDSVAPDGHGPRPPGRGLGLRGMHERAASAGGTVVAGPTERGWRVEAAVPVPAVRGVTA